jgi:hypothetical protein
MELTNKQHANVLASPRCHGKFNSRYSSCGASALLRTSERHPYEDALRCLNPTRDAFTPLVRICVSQFVGVVLLFLKALVVSLMIGRDRQRDDTRIYAL